MVGGRPPPGTRTGLEGAVTLGERGEHLACVVPDVGGDVRTDAFAQRLAVDLGGDEGVHRREPGNRVAVAVTSRWAWSTSSAKLSRSPHAK